MGMLNSSVDTQILGSKHTPTPFARRYVYAAGTDLLRPLYVDGGLTITQANPIIADAAGRLELAYVIDGNYRVVDKDINGVVLRDLDDLRIDTTHDLGPVRDFAKVELLFADTLLSYDVGIGRLEVTVGSFVTADSGRFLYEVMPEMATDHHLQTAGGIKLRVRAGSGGYHVDAFGAKGDGVADDTSACQKALAATEDGGSVTFDANSTYRIIDVLDTTGTAIGKRIFLAGAKILLQDNAATIRLGQQGSGLLLDNGEVRAMGNFTGTAVTLMPQARSTDAGRSWLLSDGNISCVTETGVAIGGLVDKEDTRIVGLRASNVTIAGFEYGCRLRCEAPSGVGFINDNEFVSMRIPVRTHYGVHLSASATGVNEVSGNKFTNLMTQYFSGVSVRHILIADEGCKRNKFTSYDAWDIGGAATLLVEDSGCETLWIGTVPTSGGVAKFSQTAIGIINKDAGSQTAELMLGDYRRSNSVETRKIQNFTTTELGTLDVRNGDVMIEGTVAYGTRLTNIIGGGKGQTVTLIFGGHTLLSNAWGGTGQIRTRNGDSRYPVANEASQFTYTGTDWIEHGSPAAIYEAASLAELSSLSSRVNTTGKFIGKLIWDSTSKRMLRAEGAVATSVWAVVDGSATVAPT